jgi:phosphoribosylformimino-5-aminoimidazole carboxamide ribotide isomerase
MTIIPAIDIINGKCVRLSKGDYAQQTIYNEDPVEVAKQFVDAGFSRLHIVDLDGAKVGRLLNLPVLEKIASAVNCIIDFGGGIKQKNDVQAILDAGATLVTVGSIAVKEPATLENWIGEFGAGTFMIGADVLDGKIRISGWQEDTGIHIFDLLSRLQNLGVSNIFCTDISLDGMLQGPSFELYKQIIAEYPSIKLIASGGVSDISDVQQLKELGCAGVIIGKAIYEKRVTLEQLIMINSK